MMIQTFIRYLIEDLNGSVSNVSVIKDPQFNRLDVKELNKQVYEQVWCGNSEVERMITIKYGNLKSSISEHEVVIYVVHDGLNWILDIPCLPMGEIACLRSFFNQFLMEPHEWMEKLETLSFLSLYHRMKHRTIDLKLASSTNIPAGVSMKKYFHDDQWVVHPHLHLDANEWSIYPTRESYIVGGFNSSDQVIGMEMSDSDTFVLPLDLWFPPPIKEECSMEKLQVDFGWNENRSSIEVYIGKEKEEVILFQQNGKAWTHQCKSTNKRSIIRYASYMDETDWIRAPLHSYPKEEWIDRYMVRFILRKSPSIWVKDTHAFYFQGDTNLNALGIWLRLHKIDLEDENLVKIQIGESYPNRSVFMQHHIPCWNIVEIERLLNVYKECVVVLDDQEVDRFTQSNVSSRVHFILGTSLESYANSSIEACVDRIYSYMRKLSPFGVVKDLFFKNE